MKPINGPSVIIGQSNEQSIQALKGWGNEIAGELTYQLSQMESEIESLKAEVERLKEAQDGV